MYTLKGCILAFISGAFFFFLVLSSRWWILVAAILWAGYFYLEAKHPEIFSSDKR